MQPRHFLVHLLGKRVDAGFMALGRQGDLRQTLVGEAVAHHEAGMTGGAPQIDQAPFGQNDHRTAGGQNPAVHLRLDGLLAAAGGGFQVAHLDFAVEMADVANDGFVFHLRDVGAADDVAAAGGGDEDVPQRGGRFHGGDLVALHGGLQGADRVDLGDQHPRAVAAHRLRAPLAHIAVSIDHHYFAGQHDVGGALDAVGQRFTAAVQIVELGLGDRVVHVEGRKEQFAAFLQLIQTMHAGGGFFRHAAHLGGHAGPEAGVPRIAVFQTRHQAAHVFTVVDLIQQGGVFFHGYTLVDEHGGVAAVVHDQVRPAAVRPHQHLLGAPPVLIERLPLPGENGRRAFFGDGRRGVVLGAENIAGGPADVRAQKLERVDQHGGLYGHVQASGDLEAFEGLFGAVGFAHGHQPGHLVFRQGHLFVAQRGQGRIGHFIPQTGVECQNAARLVECFNVGHDSPFL